MAKKRSRYEVWGASVRSRYFRKISKACQFAKKIEKRTTGVRIYDLKLDKAISC